MSPREPNFTTRTRPGFVPFNASIFDFVMMFLGWPGTFYAMNQPRLIEVFHEYNFVMRLVVDQFIDKRAGHEQSEAARPEPFLLSHLHMSVRLVRVVTDGSVRELVG